jgi:hypothetical protein
MFQWESCGIDVEVSGIYLLWIDCQHESEVAHIGASTCGPIQCIPPGEDGEFGVQEFEIRECEDIVIVMVKVANGKICFVGPSAFAVVQSVVTD